MSAQEFPVPVPLKEAGIEGTKEKEMRQTIILTYILLNVWRFLITEADCTVLLKKRQENPTNKYT